MHTAFNSTHTALLWHQRCCNRRTCAVSIRQVAVLALAFCPITSRSVTTVASRCEHISHLEIRSCSGVSIAAMETAVRTKPQLAFIDLDSNMWFKLVPKTVLAKPVSELTADGSKNKAPKGKGKPRKTRAQRLQQRLAGMYARHQKKRRIAMAVVRPILSPVLGL